MTTSSEPPVPVWGIEVGGGLLRAIRVVRLAEGGFQILSYDEQELPGHGPGELISYIRKKGLRQHPLVVAIRSPAPHYATVQVSPEEMLLSSDELRETFLEHLHQEPEFVDLRYTRLAPATWLLCAEERARVESYLVALETLGAPAYALVSSTDGLYGTLRRTGLFKDDGLAIRIEPHWTDFLFLDGPSVRRQGLPVGFLDLTDEDVLGAFATDAGMFIDYHLTRMESEGVERIVLLGVDGDLAKRIGSVLPIPPTDFPGEAVKIRGKGRITDQEARRLLRLAPGAVGAALAGAVRPHKLDLAFRPLPDELSVPKTATWPWFAASAILWLALLVCWLGVSAGITALGEREAAAILPPLPTAKQQERFDSLTAQARQAAALPAAVERIFALTPGEEHAPCNLERLLLKARPGGGYEGELRVRTTGGEAFEWMLLTFPEQKERGEGGEKR